MSLNPNYYRLNSNSVILTTIAFIVAVIVTLIGKPFYAPSHLTFEVKNDQPDHYSIYVNTGFGYNEEEQNSIRLRQSEQETLLEFPLPASRIRGLRFDPGTKSGEVLISKMCLSSLQEKTCWDSTSLFRAITPISGIEKFSVQDDVLHLTTVGPDPSLDLGNGLTTAHAVLTKLPSLLIFSLMFFGIVFAGAGGPILYRFISQVSAIYPRDCSKEKLFSLFLTLAFILIAGFTALHHEMWRDELHTWLVGRDSNSVYELYQNTRYDGHGLLWYIAVWPLTRITENPFAIQVLHFVLATITVYIVTRFSPFSRAQKVLLVFGYLFAYEYAIIARNYALGVLFLVIFCTLYSKRPREYMLLAITLVLMANTSAHALIISVGLAIGYAIYLRRDGLPVGKAMRSLIIATAIFTLGVGVQILIATPPPDLGLNYADKATALEWDRIIRVFGLFESALLAKRPDLEITLWSLLPLIFLLRWIRQPAVMLFFLSACGALLFLFYFVYFGSPRHHGFIFLALIAGLWLAAYQRPIKTSRKGHRFYQFWNPLSNITFSILLCFHLYSGYLASQKDINQVFSNGQATANYLKDNQLHDLPIVAFADWPTTSVLGYLETVKHFYHVQGHRWASYVVQDSSRLNWPSMREVIEEARELTGERIILLVNVPVSENLIQETGINPLAQFTGAGIASENFYVYEIEKNL